MVMILAGTQAPSGRPSVVIWDIATAMPPRGQARYGPIRSEGGRRPWLGERAHLVLTVAGPVNGVSMLDYSQSHPHSRIPNRMNVGLEAGGVHRGESMGKVFWRPDERAVFMQSGAVWLKQCTGFVFYNTACKKLDVVSRAEAAPSIRRGHGPYLGQK
jgi:hypothetical protein